MPIHTVPKWKGSLLKSRASRNPLDFLNRKYRIDHIWKSETSSLRSKLKSWEQSTGLRHRSFFDLNHLADNLNVRNLHHIPFPDGISEQDGKIIRDLIKSAFSEYFTWPSVINPMSTKFLTRVGKQLKQASIGQYDRLKYVLYVGHDSSISSVMSRLGFPLAKNPNYASRLNFSLYRNKEVDYVKVSFNGKTLSLPKCGGDRCTLQEFASIVKTK